MTIGETISASYARSRVKHSRPARTGGADAIAASFASHRRERSSRFANMDFDERQSRITAILSACDLDLNMWPVAGAVRGAELTMTGHSLGGGLAADAAIATGRSAVTFNAAGLNPLTVLDEGGLSFGGSVINYSVEGEILTELQSHTIAPGSFGMQYQIAPAAQDAGYSPIQLHYISSVMDALGL